MLREEKEFNSIFSKQLKRYLAANGLSQMEFAEKLGVSTSTVSSWCTGVKCPRMDKVDKMCEILHCRRAELIADVMPTAFDGDISHVLERMMECRELRMLYEVANESKPQDIMLAVDFLTRIRQAERG